MFNYGVGFGSLKGVLAAKKVPFVLVPPGTWHRALFPAGAKGEPKARALEFVRQRWPTFQLILPRGRTPHQGLVDAACIAHWGRRCRS